MKKLIILYLITLIGCKKTEKEPEQIVNITFYHKKGNFTYNKADDTGQKTSSNNYEVVNVNLYGKNKNNVILIKNNSKQNNDSLNLKVTYNGVTSQKALNCSNIFVSLQFQVSEIIK
jgi:hypothetical protein